MIQPKKKKLIFLKHTIIYILMNPYFKKLKPKSDFLYKWLHVEYGSGNQSIFYF